MKNKITKSILGIILLTISPFVLLTIVGFIYVLIQLIGGVPFTDGVQSFINFIYSLVPFFKYLTVIPIILVIIMVLIKNKIINLLKR
ncbi:MAG: hypothetical protein K0R34_735 [Herbinix sp.]|jgi:hypothetical protein|nr:hypothetical protein [Herbinix sp.]